jgi:hypothetical protein
MHAVIDNALIGTWPCPLGANQLGRLTGARTPSTPWPPPPLPPGSLRAQRKVHASGRIMVAARTSSSAPVTAARSSPSSSKTPICASCTAKKRSPYVHDETSNPSSDFTSQAQEPIPRVVKHLTMTIRQECPESIHGHDVAAATLLARSGGRTHEQCRGIVIHPDDLAVQLWAIPHSTDNELLGSHRCGHRPSTARVWAPLC